MSSPYATSPWAGRWRRIPHVRFFGRIPVLRQTPPEMHILYAFGLTVLVLYLGLVVPWFLRAVLFVLLGLLVYAAAAVLLLFRRSA
jgi:hypothetical protein